MVVQSASQTAYAPTETPSISVAGDGTLAAVCEPSRVTLVELPHGAAFAEIGVDPEAEGHDVAWLGTPPRLVVLSRYASSSLAHLLDPHGPRTIAEIRLETQIRLIAAVGNCALVVGGQHAAVLTATESHLTLQQFFARATPAVAGAAGARFVVALPGAIEEWDPHTRLAKRRLRLPRVAAITAVGGSDRLVWMTTPHEPARIDVIPLVNRGQPRAHDLPEPIARITGHPRTDLVACVGAETGRLYIVDLDGRSRTRVIETGIEPVAWASLLVGRMLGVVAAQAHHPLALISLDGREFAAEPAATAILPRHPPSTLTEPPADPDDAPGATPHSSLVDDPGQPTSSSEGEAASESLIDAAQAPQRAAPPDVVPPIAAVRPAALVTARPAATRAGNPGGSPVRPPAGPASTGARPAPSVGQRFSAWRNLVQRDQPPGDPVAAARAPASHSEPRPDHPLRAWRAGVDAAAPARDDAPQSWRDEIVAWSRALGSGALHSVPAAPAIAAVVERFELAPQLQPVLVLLYGAHLCGQRGVAPVEVARLLDRRWTEALGRGELAHRAVADYTGSRVALAPAILRVLDELPPGTGTLVGEPATIALLGPCIAVAGDEPLVEVAERCRSRVGGAVLAADGEPDIAALVLEARACGAAPMLRRTARFDAAPTAPVIFVVADTELADRFGIPRLA